MSDSPENNEYELDPSDLEEVYCIKHYYDIGDQQIYVKRVTGDIDATRAALYCQFMCEHWYGHDKMLTNLGVGSLLIQFYGFQHYCRTRAALVDMHTSRQTYCQQDAYNNLIQDSTLLRDGLRESMSPHVTG
jgi:hypothetical protein